MSENNSDGYTDDTDQSSPNVTAAADTLHHTLNAWIYMNNEERKDAVERALDALVVKGDRVMESPATGEKYRVTKWVDLGDGKVTALEKEPIEEVNA